MLLQTRWWFSRAPTELHINFNTEPRHSHTSNKQVDQPVTHRSNPLSVLMNQWPDEAFRELQADTFSFSRMEAQPSSALLSLRSPVTQTDMMHFWYWIIQHNSSDGKTGSGLLPYPVKLLSAVENRTSSWPHGSGLPFFSTIHIKITSDSGFLVILFDCLRRVLQRLKAI